jgi:hypothetical protein
MQCFSSTVPQRIETLYIQIFLNAFNKRVTDVEIGHGVKGRGIVGLLPARTRVLCSSISLDGGYKWSSSYG